MRARTVIWTTILLSGVGAYAAMLSETVLPLVRYACAWYALIVAFLVFAVVGVTLSVKFRRLDSAQGWVARAFLFW